MKMELGGKNAVMGVCFDKNVKNTPLTCDFD